MPLIKFPSEGEPTKEVTAPVIVTTDGEEVVHEDAVIQTPNSVSDHVVTGDVDPDATDKGALQSPGLPVKVSSGKLGPGAAYAAQNWAAAFRLGINPTSAAYQGSAEDNWNSGNTQYSAASGDILIVAGETLGGFTPTGTLNFVTETDVSRKVADEFDDGTRAVFFGMWDVTGSSPVVEVRDTGSGTGSGDYQSSAVVLGSLTEFG